MTNVFSWIAICTGIAIIPAQLIVGIVLFYNPSYTPHAWHYFLIYQAVNGAVLLYNITLLKRSLWIYDIACEYPHTSMRFSISDNNNSLHYSGKLLRHYHNLPRSIISPLRVLGKRLGDIHQ